MLAWIDRVDVRKCHNFNRMNYWLVFLFSSSPCEWMSMVVVSEHSRQMYLFFFRFLQDQLNLITWILAGVSLANDVIRFPVFDWIVNIDRQTYSLKYYVVFLQFSLPLALALTKRKWNRTPRRTTKCFVYINVYVISSA